ncbi:2-succinyl-6-hydroxy-2,4-cyclohexadiene-1-carboxylate synthase [Pseudogracilibacillus sp. SE30717A]|uniref:2-succinyl-6-hydroxy-2, 4-cyclohexadiene-1-carboxylate synthase n=1 Tax=Pseudogracilibacillus sp. SE30717A TaxID=3098293 RepID=UPI00300DCF3F
MMYKFLKINDATYSYTIQGEGETLVLLHGFTGSSMTWEDCVKKWARHFKVITIDLPGHGKTATKSLRTMEAFCEDLKTLLITMNIESAHILGYSMGGRTALTFALLYPEMVRSLILESASPGLKTKEEQEKRMETDALLAEQIMVNGVLDFVYYWENIPLFKSQKQLPAKVREKIRTERLSHRPEGLAESLLFMGTGRQKSNWGQLPDLNKPVLLIVGEVDQKFVSINEKMKNKFPQAKLEIVKKAGHAVHVEQVEKFVKIVREFIKEKNYIKEGAIHDSSME